MRTAVIHPGAIGDLVLTLPLIQTLARQGQNTVELVGGPERACLFAGRSAVSSARSIDDLPLAELFAKSPPSRLSTKLAEWLTGFERIVSGLPSETFIANLRRVFRGEVIALDVRPADIEASNLHASEFLHRQLFDSPPLMPQLSLPTEESSAGRVLLARADQPTVVIHPGSGGRAKCWPIELFAQVATLLAGQGWKVVFTIGPAEHERFPVTLRSTLAMRFIVLADLSLVQLLSVIAASDVFLGNDSGPTHLAAALGQPTVALFGPTDPAIWSPRGRCVRVIPGRADQADWHIEPGEVARAVAGARSPSGHD